MSVNFQHSTWCHIPDNSNLLSHCCEYLKSNTKAKPYQCLTNFNQYPIYLTRFTMKLQPLVTEVIPHMLFTQCVTSDKMPVIYYSTHTAKVVSLTSPLLTATFNVSCQTQKQQLVLNVIQKYSQESKRGTSISHSSERSFLFLEM